MAVLGIGIDMCNIERIKKALERAGFAERVFTDAEIAYAGAQSLPARHFASAFAAREALAKAGGWGLGLMGLKSCQVQRTRRGTRFLFSDEFAKRLAGEGISSVQLSISHEGDMVVAVVVIEGDESAMR